MESYDDDPLRGNPRDAGGLAERIQSSRHVRDYGAVSEPPGAISKPPGDARIAQMMTKTSGGLRAVVCSVAVASAAARAGARARVPAVLAPAATAETSL
eukprot:3714774-Pyramimonas_sp.AAC.1